LIALRASPAPYSNAPTLSPPLLFFPSSGAMGLHPMDECVAQGLCCGYPLLPAHLASGSRPALAGP